jgi:hypothetical protein
VEVFVAGIMLIRLSVSSFEISCERLTFIILNLIAKSISALDDLGKCLI